MKLSTTTPNCAHMICDIACPLLMAGGGFSYLDRYGGGRAEGGTAEWPGFSIASLRV